MEAINEGMIREKKGIQINAKDVMSTLVILFLSCVIIIFSALISDMVIRMAKGTPYTIVYNTKIVDEGPAKFGVNF